SSYISLACSYREAINDLESITGFSFDTLHIIGGGSLNDYLNQLTADITGKTVIAGPQEATSLGTIAMQILYHDPGQTLGSLRKIIAKTLQPKVFEPRKDFNADSLYSGYLRNKDYENSLS
ncbi:MAG: hypothetical protein JW760_06080, partial [Spirochaetales bacterium]|nr:hypothetical protein [Spirochaetales bacterium]